MGLKLTGAGWIAANIENQQQRDAKRPEFFAQTGVPVARSLRDIHLSLPTRRARMDEQLAKTRANRIGETSLVEAVDAAEAALALVGLGIASIPLEREHQSLGLAALAPEALKNFFLTAQETALEHALTAVRGSV